MITHPSLTLLSHTFSREDLFLVIYCLVDDWMGARFGSSNTPRRRRGPRPDEFSDAEVLTVLLVGELCHCPREAAWLRQVRASYRALFPALPEDSRFSRRAARVRELLRAFRSALLFWADADLEPFRLFDSFPQPLCACYRIGQSHWPLRNAHFGYNASKKQYFYGMRPQMLITASVAGEPLGIAQAALDAAVDYAKERRQFGRPIGEFQLVQGKLADMYTQLEAARWLVYHTAALAWHTPPGRRVSKECAAAILFSAEMSTRVALDAVQIFGGAGYMAEAPVARYLRDAKLLEIGAGTSEIRRMLIGRKLLGLT